jgi:hypothetical protein
VPQGAGAVKRVWSNDAEYRGAEMDGLQFLASVIGSLAWPGAVLAVLWYNRVRLSNLFSNAPEWIEELTLPGGTKIRFPKAAQKAAETAQLIAPVLREAEASTGAGKVTNEIAPPFRFHESLVVESFLEIIELCGKFVGLLTLPTKGRDPEAVIAELAHLGFIEPEGMSLFKYLRDGYQSAVREGYGRVKESDARSYRNAALTLISALREALPRVEEVNPRKQAGWASYTDHGSEKK